MKCSGWCGDGENGGFYGGLIQYRVVTKIFLKGSTKYRAWPELFHRVMGP
jgi:hypothetical protein